MPPRRSARLLAKNEAAHAAEARNVLNEAQRSILLLVNTVAGSGRNIHPPLVFPGAQPDGSRRNSSGRGPNSTINHRVARFLREPPGLERPVRNHVRLIFRRNGFTEVSDNLQDDFQVEQETLPLDATLEQRAAAHPYRGGSPENPNQTKLGLRRLQSEITKMQSEPTDGCQVELHGDSLYNWKAIITGPTDTPYEGGHFELRIRFPKMYPCQPPSLQFRTKIFHCNINHGFICMDILGSNWSAALTVEKLLLSVRSLLADPNPDSPMNCVVAEMYKKNRKQHDILAREWTAQYAQPGATPSVPLRP